MSLYLFLAAAACPTLLLAQTVITESQAHAFSMAHFRQNSQQYGLADPSSDLRLRSSDRDTKTGYFHIRYDQYYRGIRVFGAQAISHILPTGQIRITNALRGNLNMDVNPIVPAGRAVRSTLEALALRGSFEASKPTLEILPRGKHYPIDLLAWHVQVFVDNDLDPPAGWDVFVDASNAAVVWKFNSLKTTAAAGQALTMYSGAQPIILDEAIVAGREGYYLADPTRGGIFIGDMKNQNPNLITNPNYLPIKFFSYGLVFGDGKGPWAVARTNRATAAADAFFALEKAWDYFLVKFGRNGIDGKGKAPWAGAHWGLNMNNAAWWGRCQCIRFGDGDSITFYPLVSVDTVAHEWAHGVLESKVNLPYEAETGGLDEGNSDFFGTMVEFFSGKPGANYSIGEDILVANHPVSQGKALRYMDDPAAGGLPACWSPDLGNPGVDPHISVGPADHMFYLLINGGTSKCNGTIIDYPVGTAVAEKIWYKAITSYFTDSTNYAAARKACMDAVDELYGNINNLDPNYGEIRNSVATAFDAINVH